MYFLEYSSLLESMSRCATILGVVTDISFLKLLAKSFSIVYI